jgi:hypothetical protein
MAEAYRPRIEYLGDSRELVSVAPSRAKTRTATFFYRIFDSVSRCRFNGMTRLPDGDLRIA